MNARLKKIYDATTEEMQFKYYGDSFIHNVCINGIKRVLEEYHKNLNELSEVKKGEKS